MQDSFREHLSVADVLKANYSSADDIDRVEAINALENELRQMCCSREANVQATLRGLPVHSSSCSIVFRLYTHPEHVVVAHAYVTIILE